MMNTVEFGQFVRATRATRSQQEIASGAGTFRQRLGAIEQGDTVELTEKWLTQLDTAFDWPHGLAAAKLQCTQQPPSTPKPILYQRAEHTPPLGFATDQTPIALPKRLLANVDSRLFLPLVAAWPGTALIDLTTTTDDELPEWDRLALYALNHDRAVLQIGTDAVPTADQIAVEPLSAIRTLAQAHTLVNALMSSATTAPIRANVQAAAMTLLLLAATHAAGDSDDNDPLSLCVRANVDLKLQLALQDKMAEYLSGPRREVADLELLFGGLLAARDMMADYVIDDETGTVVPGTPRVQPITDLEGKVVFYDSRVIPELPVVVQAFSMNALAIGCPDTAPPTDGDGSVIMIQPTMPSTPRSALDAELQAQPVTADTGTLGHFSGASGLAVYTESGQARAIRLPAG